MTLPFDPRHVSWRLDDGVAVISLARPERKNPLTFDSHAELRDTFRTLWDFWLSLANSQRLHQP